jgi:hypothetical protein
MGKNLAGVRIYGDILSAVYAAASGTTGPVGLAAVAVAYKDMGWLGESGVSLSRKVDVKKFKAHQGGTVVKTKVTGTENSFKFQCSEENAIVLGLMHAGSSGVTAVGVSTITVPGGMTADPRAWVVDEFEGTSIQTRYIIPVGTVGDRGEVVMSSEELTIYEFTVDITGDFSIVTNSTAVVYPVP